MFFLTYSFSEDKKFSKAPPKAFGFGATEHVILKNIKLVLEIMIKNKHMKSQELCLAKKR